MCVLWGIPYLMIRVAVREISPATLVFLRTSTAALILLPLAAYRSELRVLLPRWRPLVVFAVIEIALPWLALSSAERRVTSSVAALLLAAVPFVAVAIAATTRTERMDRRRVTGLLVGVAGVAAIVGFDLGHLSAVGVVEMLFVAVCYAVGPWILRHYLSDLPSLGVIAASLGMTAVVYAPVAALQLPSSVPSAEAIASVAGLAFACTAVAFVLFFELIAEAGAVRATVITYVNPAVAALLGVTVLSERFTLAMGIGFVLVLAGSVLATSSSRQRAVVEA
jgi:drug/metabolite transporter (DMT)-like permease